MKAIMKDWNEEEIYRIDHFLGEELVRDIQVLRFANENLIEPFMNKDKVGAIIVELLEEFGCEGRGGYFDEFGLIRDVHQNRMCGMVRADRRLHRLTVGVPDDRPSTGRLDTGDREAEVARR